MPVSVKDLRYKTRQVLNQVRRGETPVITFHGRPIARIIPFSRPKKGAFREIGFGMWHDHEALKDVNQWLDEQRKPRHTR
ncbi:MAG: type II toxin-antitoxin system prevent-host-death family antitoxin [Deltaproteobacteria bacterium]|nr:type II toxin-antitoxin system prevent-host-death family antitoxin [Deltaproteobacteria bacterium]